LLHPLAAEITVGDVCCHERFAGPSLEWLRLSLSILRVADCCDNCLALCETEKARQSAGLGRAPLRMLQRSTLHECTLHKPSRLCNVQVDRAGGSSLVLVHLFLLRPCKTHAPRVSSGRLPPRRASHPPPHRHTPSSGIAHTGPHRHAPTQAHTGVRAERIVACETGAARERREREAGTHGNSKLQRAPASRSRSPPQCSTRSRALHGPASTALCQAPRGGHARGRRGSTWVQGEVTSAVATRWCPPT
jgi:hypothetical protein